MGYTSVNLQDELSHVVIHSNSKYNPKLRMRRKCDGEGTSHPDRIVEFFLPAAFIQLYAVLLAIQDGSYDIAVNENAQRFCVVVGGKLFTFSKSTALDNAELLLPKVRQVALYVYSLNSFQYMLKRVQDMPTVDGKLCGCEVMSIQGERNLGGNIVKFTPKPISSETKTSTGLQVTDNLIDICQMYLDKGADARTIVRAILEAVTLEQNSDTSKGVDVV